jgi:hypothetical protein
MNETLPVRLLNESASDFFERVNEEYLRHLSGCRECNYDHECMACAAGVSGHNCNCSYGAGDGGYGIRLRRLVEAARQVADPKKKLP